VFVKGGTTQKVWFYDMQSDGYTLDDKRDKIEANDLPDIVKEWKTRSKTKNDDRKEKHFVVPIKEIIENNYDLSINRYKEIAYEPTKYEKPEKILDKIEKIEDEISSGLAELRKLI
jgi:type I restriction enzyme M protein